MSPRWSRRGWHTIECWRHWAANPDERGCACSDIEERQRVAAQVAACPGHDIGGPPDEPSGFPTCSRCGAILTDSERGTTEERLIRALRRLGYRSLGTDEGYYVEVESAAAGIAREIRRLVARSEVERR